MKIKSSNKTFDPTVEQDIREIWQAIEQPDGPSAETLAHVNQIIRQAAEPHNKRRVLRMPMLLPAVWRPVLAAAAVFMLLLGIARFLPRPPLPQPAHTELTAVEQAITRELEQLEVIIWDALTELEHDGTTNEALLQALALQMTRWEDI